MARIPYFDPAQASGRAAEAYARLVFPLEAWRFTPLLKPTAGSALAAMADITQPWTQRTNTTFTGDATHTFTLPLTPPSTDAVASVLV